MERGNVEVLTTNELIALTGVPRSRIQNWIRTGRIQPYERINRTTILWARWQVEEILKLRDTLKRGNPNFRRKASVA